MTRCIQDLLNRLCFRQQAKGRHIAVLLLPESRTIMSQCFNAINKYRRAHWLYEHKFRSLARIYEMWIYLIHNSFIPPECEIGEGTTFGYKGIGVVVHKRAKIGKNCVIAQGVTIGGRGGHYDVPEIGDNCYIGAGAKVLGPITLGDNVVVGANAVMTKSAPSNTVWAGVPARLIRSSACVVATSDDAVINEI